MLITALECLKHVGRGSYDNEPCTQYQQVGFQLLHRCLLVGSCARHHDASISAESVIANRYQITKSACNLRRNLLKALITPESFALNKPLSCLELPCPSGYTWPTATVVSHSESAAPAALCGHLQGCTLSILNMDLLSSNYPEILGRNFGNIDPEER